MWAEPGRDQKLWAGGSWTWNAVAGRATLWKENTKSITDIHCGVGELKMTLYETRTITLWSEMRNRSLWRQQSRLQLCRCLEVNVIWIMERANRWRSTANRKWRLEFEWRFLKSDMRTHWTNKDSKYLRGGIVWNKNYTVQKHTLGFAGVRRCRRIFQHRRNPDHVYFWYS